METAVFALMNRAPNFASAAEDMAAQIMCDMLRISIVEGDVVLSGHEHVASHSAVGFWFGEVRHIAVDCEDHVARAVGEYCFSCVAMKSKNCLHSPIVFSVRFAC